MYLNPKFRPLHLATPRHRIHKRIGRLSYQYQKRLSHLHRCETSTYVPPPLVKPTLPPERVSRDLFPERVLEPHPISRYQLLHIPEYYGRHFKSFVFVPRLYHSFLHTTKCPTVTLSPIINISEVRATNTTKSPTLCSYTTESTLNNTPIVVDSGATFGITPFVEYIIPGTLKAIELDVNNLSGKSKITARGFGRWTVKDKHGTTATIEPFLHVVPTAEIRLFSPQNYFQGLKGGNYTMDENTTILTLPSNEILEIPYHHANNLPMIFPVPYSTALSLDFDTVTSSSIHLSVSDEKNQNLSAAQKEYLLKHKLISHANGSWCQELMRDRKFDDGSGNIVTLPPVLKTKHLKTRSCHICKCAACLLAKLGKQPLDDSVKSSKSEMTLKQDILFPGDRVFCDQYESSVLERK